MSDANPFGGEYFQALSLPTADVGSPEYAARRTALKRAHELRQFEIENYWRRATYFWAFQLAAFTLLGLLWQETDKGSLEQNALLIPAGLGTITALVGALTAMGSKFWQENWEAHVDALETDLEGRLTQVVFAEGPTKFSVSRVNERLLWILAAGWLVLFLWVGFAAGIVIPSKYQSLIALLLLTGSALTVCWGTATRFRGMQIFAGDKNWAPIKRRVGRKRWRLLLRTTALSDPAAMKTPANTDVVE